jgi:hypothetical protein
MGSIFTILTSSVAPCGHGLVSTGCLRAKTANTDARLNFNGSEDFQRLHDVGFESSAESADHCSPDSPILSSSFDQKVVSKLTSNTFTRILSHHIDTSQTRFLPLPITPPSHALQNGMHIPIRGLLRSYPQPT